MPLQVSPYLLLCLTSLFWSLNLIIGKVLAGAVPPATLSFLRWLPAFVFFLIFYGKNLRDGYRVLREHPMLVLLLGATGYSINSITVYEAVTYSTTINISFINAFNPVLIAVTGYIMYRYPVSAGRLSVSSFPCSASSSSYSGVNLPDYWHCRPISVTSSC